MQDRFFDAKWPVCRSGELFSVTTTDNTLDSTTLERERLTILSSDADWCCTNKNETPRITNPNFPRMFLFLLLTLGVFLAPHVSAAPTLLHPVADQRPVIARVDEAYDFRLLYDTFTTTTAAGTRALVYSAAGLPGWLAFDNTTLSFSGTPSLDDVGILDISLTATDTTTTTTRFTILVSDAPSPAIHQGFDTQIRDTRLHQFNTAQALPSGQGVYIHPYYSFSMGFQQSTFRPGRGTQGQSVFYSARLRGDTSLPDWLAFDNETVTFSGTAPAEGSYTIVVTGADVWGYTAVENSFVVEVGTTFVDVAEGAPLGNVTTTAGTEVRAVLDLSGVTVAGEKGEVVVEADLKEFPWLSFDRWVLLVETGGKDADCV